MEVKCEYCGSLIPDTAAFCPQCGGVNNNMKRSADNTPKTIEELKKWYADRQLPPYETTRFFIGINYTQPRAFGIYEENGKFIVYKNKDNGQRAIRYEGTDEAYAVNELYLKLKSEILNQKEHNQASRNSSDRYSRKKSKSANGFTIPIFILIILFCTAIIHKPLLALAVTFGPWILFAVAAVIFSNIDASGWAKVQKVWLKIMPFLIAGMLLGVAILGWIGATPKYYRVGDNLYCKYNSNYYLYNFGDYSSVEDYELPYELEGDYAENYRVDGDSISSVEDFENSWYYSENFASSSSDSSDSDYDWDSGSSWDSGSTDWGSDW